nr:tripartite tricarboxylate transporter substrate binding protein [Candidimonas humi]
MKYAAILGLSVCATLFGSNPALAKYPDHAIQLVSPYAAGGANDFLTRLMAKGLSEQLKVSAVVENRAGANGMVGGGFVAKSAPDGYTLLMGNSATHGTNPTLYPKAPYDALKDFSPVAMVGMVPIVLIVNSSLHINSIKELLAYGKAHPGKLSFGSSGVGGTGHLAGEAFKMATGIDMIHAPYKGDAPAVTDTMGGQVSMAFVGVASATPMLKSGKIKILAVANPSRLSSLPDVPTMAQAGVKGVEFSQWYALMARSGTPEHRIDVLNDAVRKTLQESSVKKSLATMGAEASAMSPAQLHTFITNEIQRFGKIIHTLHIQPQ